MQTFFFQPQAQLSAARPDHVSLAMIPRFLKVLLVTDGTITRTLAAYFDEQIEVKVLSCSRVTSERDYPALGVAPNDPIVRRRVTLQGKHSRNIYTFAESVIAPDRIPQDMGHKLAEGRTGIGEILQERRLETYRDIVDIKEGTANAWARYLAIDESADVVIRNYTIHLCGKGAIQIEEVFPKATFYA